MGPEDEDYSDILRVFQGEPFLYRANPKPPTLTTIPMATVRLNPVDIDVATSQTMLRKQIALRIRMNFAARLQSLRGACYSTEVRDSGVLVCGIHHSLWDEATESCVTLEEELLALSQVASDVLSSINIEVPGAANPLTAPQERLRLLDIAMNKVQP